MPQSKWTCDRCGIEFDRKNGEEWITLIENENTNINSDVGDPYKKVCADCADDLLYITERCDKDCENCEVTFLWGLSALNCEKFRKNYGLY